MLHARLPLSRGEAAAVALRRSAGTSGGPPGVLDRLAQVDGHRRLREGDRRILRELDGRRGRGEARQARGLVEARAAHREVARGEVPRDRHGEVSGDRGAAVGEVPRDRLCEVCGDRGVAVGEVSRDRHGEVPGHLLRHVRRKRHGDNRKPTRAAHARPRVRARTRSCKHACVRAHARAPFRGHANRRRTRARAHELCARNSDA
mmetsp:Transcript_159081/g.510183  ORF Transcript_159081/g.510183 Transcript_159081/m.510183 type:complete len:204 (+) Transcript_159081:2211-2822(+)